MRGSVLHGDFSLMKRLCLKKTTHQLQDSHNRDEVKTADTEAHEFTTSKRRRQSVKRLNFDSSPDKANTPYNSKRVRLCIPDGPQLNCEDFIDLDNIQAPVTSSVKNVASPWLPELNLTVDDRNIITKHYANTPMQYTAIFHGCKNVNF